MTTVLRFCLLLRIIRVLVKARKAETETVKSGDLYPEMLFSTIR